MFNSFPRPVPDGRAGSPSPLDWSAYSAVYNWTGTPTSVPSTSYGTCLDITGEGYLLFVQGASETLSSTNPNVRITVDGVAYVFSGVNAGGVTQGNVLVSPIYYKSSLKIELFNRNASANNLQCDYTYLSKTSNPSKTQTLLSSSTRNMAYGKNGTASNADVANIVGSGYILAIECSGFYTTAASIVSVTITVDSVVKANDRNVIYTGGEEYKQNIFIGPIRFTTDFKVQHRLNVVGSTAITGVWYTLD